MQDGGAIGPCLQFKLISFQVGFHFMKFCTAKINYTHILIGTNRETGPERERIVPKHQCVTK